MNVPGFPPKQGLYDPQFEKDACGIGFVVMEKWMCLGAMIAAGILLLIFGLDLALGWPFDRAGKVTDVLFVIAGAFVLWQGYETWREVA